MDHQSRLSRLLETDWYSPRRLLGSPTDFDFQDAYRQKVAENLNLDSEGKPFRMLVFRGSPKSRRKSYRLIDELRREDAEALRNSTEQIQRRRQLPKKEARILDAPNLRNDYYSNMMDWGRNNILAIALGLELYLWKQENGEVQKLLKVTGEDDFPTSISWSQDAKTLAVGYMASKLQLWDAETSKLIRNLEGHDKRVATASWNHWNGHILTSGSQDKSIINHDVRVSNNVTSRINAHTAEVCGLKWSNEGNLLASGGDDNLVHVWDHSKMSSSKCLHRFRDHRAAVKALAWCPYQFNVLASGGGTQDGCIKIWNVQKEWNRHHKEILSGHGFSSSGDGQKLCLWKYPHMTKWGELQHQTSRILELSQSPDGLTVVSAAADETLRFWEAFGPSGSGDFVSHLDGLLSLKADWLVNSRLLVKGTAVASRL
ncbi:WD REPEATS REGION domain-containing protein [Citrus sinensis]|nr:WD REPEATS REGION domain-containing protein [Citrus sinensis]